MRLIVIWLVILLLPSLASAELAARAEPTQIGQIAVPCPEGQTRCDDGTCKEICPIILNPVPGALPELPGFCDMFLCDDGRCLDREEDCRCSEELPHMCEDGSCVGSQRDCDECAILCDNGSCVRDRSECPSEPVSEAETAGNDRTITVDNDDAPTIKGKKILQNAVPEVEVRGWDSVQKEPVDTQAKKPKEIVVVGSKTAADDKHKEWIEVLSVSDGDPDRPVITGGVYSSEDLQTVAEALTIVDEDIQEIHLTENSTSMTYTQSAKFLGIFPYEYGLDVDVEDTGRVKVKFPWILSLSTDNTEEIRIELEEELQEVTEGGHNGRAHRLVTMSNVMKQYRESDMDFVSR